MARINLLPWREARRKERQRQFISVALGSVLVMAGLLLLAHLQINTLVEHQTARNDFLNQQIAIVDGQIAEIKTLETEKVMLLARMNVIKELQRSRPISVHLMDELAKSVPDGLYYSSVKLQGSALTLEGVAQSNARVSSLMRNIDASAWLENPVLDVIEAGDKAKLKTTGSRYVLRVTQKQETTDPNATDTATGSKAFAQASP